MVQLSHPYMTTGKTISQSVQSLTRVRLFVTPWTAACQAPLSMGFSRQQYWSGLPFPSPGDLPNPGIEPMSLALADGFFTTEPPRKPQEYIYGYKNIESSKVITVNMSTTG